MVSAVYNFIEWIEVNKRQRKKANKKAIEHLRRITQGMDIVSMSSYEPIYVWGSSLDAVNELIEEKKKEENV